MKTYFSRSQSRFWAAEFPVGDPFGGPAYGEFRDPATILGGSSIVSGLISSDAASSAADAQANAANNAAATQKAMFDTINGQQAPYRQAGYNALSALMQGFGASPTSYNTNGMQNGAPVTSPVATPTATAGGSYQMVPAGSRDGAENSTWQWVPAASAAPGATTTAPVSPTQTGFTGINSGQFSHQFDANDLKNGLAPNYDWQLAQGLGATNNAASVTGGLVGGNALKGMQDYTQGLAGNAYQQAFNNYNAQQTNIFNRLSNIAGLGNTANQTTATAGNNAAGNIGSAQLANGAAQAAGIVGGNNALSGGLNNAASSYYLRNMMQPTGSTGASGSDYQWIAPGNL